MECSNIRSLFCQYYKLNEQHRVALEMNFISFLDGTNRKFGHEIKFFRADIVCFNYIAQYIKGIRPLTNFL